jgi:ligand-binding SRPBCC domain-containing protein
MRHNFQSEQWLPHPVELVFAFFADPENLPGLMPSWQKACIEEVAFTPPPVAASTHTKSLAAGAGTRVTLSFRPLPYSPIRIAWEAEISEFVWNDHFCDRQLHGPFAYWHHCHSVSSESRAGRSGTRFRDDVEYEVPFGKLGELAQRLFIARQLLRAFACRHARTDELLAVQKL